MEIFKKKHRDKMKQLTDRQLFVNFKLNVIIRFIHPLTLISYSFLAE